MFNLFLTCFTPPTPRNLLLAYFNFWGSFGAFRRSFVSETKCLNRPKKEAWCILKLLVLRGRRAKNIRTPKSLPGICRGPRRTVLVYRFGRPKSLEKVHEVWKSLESVRSRLFPDFLQSREVSHGVGADGVGVKFPIFAVKLLLFALVL